VAGDYSYGANIRLCPTPPGGAATAVCTAYFTASGAYQKLSRGYQELTEEAVEAGLQARAIVADARDYPGSKLFEDIVQALGEHRLTKALAKVATVLSPLQARISAKTTALTSCYNTGWTLAQPSWLAIQGYAAAPVAPGSVPACT
jgi:hypothetical protein